MMPFGHMGIGLIFAKVTGLNPLLILIGCVIPDLDILLCYFGEKLHRFHRTFTHSLLFILTLFLISLFANPIFPILIGVIAHLISDGIFYPSIPLFYPSKWKPPSIMFGEPPLINNKKRLKLINWKDWIWSYGFVIELLSVLIGLIVFFQ